MRVIYTLAEMTETARGWLAGGSVGFVPTMGYLHRGHAKLIQSSREECEISVVSIFVNPLQFASPEEMKLYPRDIARDFQLLTSSNVDFVFVPRVEDMYPPHFSSYVTPLGQIAEGLEGAKAPDKMRGVATVITKLLQLVRPDVAYFGQKDIQQVAIVRQVIRDLNIDVKLQVLPTVREADGLAVSSRNQDLSLEERRAATVLYRALQAGEALIKNGERAPLVVKQAMASLVASEPLVVLDYLAICHPDTFISLEEIQAPALLMIAAQIAGTRLTDNLLWSDAQSSW